MSVRNLSKCFSQVVFISVLVEVHRDRVLSAFYFDHRRNRLEETRVVSKVLDSQRRRHDYELQGISFL